MNPILLDFPDSFDTERLTICAPRPGHPGHQQRDDATAEAQLRLAEARGGVGDGDVAGHRQLHAAAQAGAVDQRDGERVEERVEHLHGVGAALRVGEPLAHEVHGELVGDEIAAVVTHADDPRENIWFASVRADAAEAYAAVANGQRIQGDIPPGQDIRIEFQLKVLYFDSLFNPAHIFF